MKFLDSVNVGIILNLLTLSNYEDDLQKMRNAERLYMRALDGLDAEIFSAQTARFKGVIPSWGGVGMGNYYAESLNSAKLFQVYDTKIDRVKKYFREEIDFVRRNLHGRERVLELGCGYGRIMRDLAAYAAHVVGIDISPDSVRFGKEFLKNCPNCEIRVMDARHLEFGPAFDRVLCLQNGISALNVRPEMLVAESLRVLVPGGRTYFSTYSARFWEHRLAWFCEQADKGLIGEIDMQKTGDGNIVCKDGFVAVTYSPEDLERLARATGCKYAIEEVDGSSLFLVIEK